MSTARGVSFFLKKVIVIFRRTLYNPVVELFLKTIRFAEVNGQIQRGEAMTGAVIIASGVGADGETLDPTRSVGEISAVQGLILTCFEAKVQSVAVVAEQRQVAMIQKDIARMGAVCLGCRDGAGMEELLREGIAFLSSDCERILAATVEYPLVSHQTVRRMLECGKVLAFPRYHGLAGTPIVIARKAYDRLTGEDRGPGNGKPCHFAEDVLELFRRRGVLPEAIETEDETVIQSAAACAEESGQETQPAQKHSRHPLRFCTGLRLARDTVFFGPGAAQLLELIRRERSVRMASELMGISYTKAWNILRKVEKGLGAPAVSCRQGGKSGGMAVLTPEGEELLRKYRMFEERADEALQTVFAEIFSDEPGTGREPWN